MTKPNVVIIYADDLGYGDLSCFGSEYIKTPHLDAIANDGIRFTNWYSNSPVCSPSRAALLTGKHPHRVGMENIASSARGSTGLSPDEQTIVKYLKENGYRTGLFGKWHLGTKQENDPNSHEFEEFFGFLAGCIDYYSHIFYWGMSAINPVHDLWHNRTEVWREGEYVTELITRKSVEFILQNKEAPFFMYIPYNAPHYPMHAPNKYKERYAHLPWDKQIMAAMISAMDDGIGEIVQTLKENDLYENTIIFFSSDNGPSSESRNWLDGTTDLYYGGSAGIFSGHKGSLFEGGIREPAILSYPGKIEAKQVSSKTYQMIDLLPTILRLVGVQEQPDDTIDGERIAEIEPDTAAEQEARPPRQLFWSYEGQLAVREDKWKLVIDGRLHLTEPEKIPIQLSNLETDPGEKNNLAKDYPELTKRLEKAVKEWYETEK